MNSTGSLSIIRMNDNGLKGTIPVAFRDLSSLEELNLVNNFFNGQIPETLGELSSLEELNLANNFLSGQIPETFGNLRPLQKLNFSNNQLNGQIPASLFHSCNLTKLDLSHNNLTGQFHEIVQAFSHCSQIPPLQTLNLGWNEITGIMPDLSQLSNLHQLLLDNNKLIGTVHESIGQLSNLVDLNLQNNKLKGLISEAHFSRLSRLLTLDLSRNALIFNVSSKWVPLFHLREINLASCNLGPDFPRWLQNQTSLTRLDISQAEINGTVPYWFWTGLPDKLLNISHNLMRGKIERYIWHREYSGYRVYSGEVPFWDHPIIDLSSNLFEGPIPAFLSNSIQLFLSNNRFSTANLLLCPGSPKDMRFLDLSNNSLTGELKDCWMHFESLIVLDLSDNDFHGNIPSSMGSLRNIQSLHLGGNNFLGELSSTLASCTKLEVFYAARNCFSGLLPSWIGDNLPKLRVLSLRSNKFEGSMPLSICNLSKLHVLDLSLNNLSGKIPKCISNLSAMATQAISNTTTISHEYDYHYSDSVDVYKRSRYPADDGHSSFGVYNDSASLTWKGKMSKYGSTLGLVISIDFSSNWLIGEIPSEIMSLVGLVSLNISRNMLSGGIPPTIGQLKSLDSLDLSRNHLSGMIPSQLAQVDRLSVLNLSYNDLSGEIPHGTQLQTRNAYDYIGNPKLCGAPLNTCPIPGHQVDENDDRDADEQFFSKGFYITMAIGFFTGFWGVCFSLIFKKSWRYTYFKFWSNAYDKLYVLAAIKIAKLQRIEA